MKTVYNASIMILYLLNIQMEGFILGGNIANGIIIKEEVMKKIRMLVALLLVLALSMLVMTACSKPTSNGNGDEMTSGDTNGTNEEAKNSVTLTTVSMYGETDANAPTYQAINQAFMEEFDYITIEDDSQASNQDWKTKIAADFSVGNEPDVIQFFTDANASDVLATDKFVTIAEIKSKYPDYAKDILADTLASAANPDGVQRAVPTTKYWEGIFCNKDLFDKYNLSLPNNWDSLLTAIETFKENRIIPFAVSLNEVPHYWIEYLLLMSAGVTGYTTVPESAPDDWIQGIEMIKTLKDLGAFPVDTDTIDNAYAETLFNEKKAAMILTGSWFASGITDQENTLVMAFPAMEGGKGQTGDIIGGVSVGFYITKKAWEDQDKRDAAVKFVMAHTNKDSIRKYWNGYGQPAAEVEPIDGMTPLARSGYQFINSAKSISPASDARISQEAYNTLTAGIVEVVAGDRTAEDLINEVLKINGK